MEKERLMHNRRQTERAEFHGNISTLRGRSSKHDKDIKTLKILIEEERNDDFIDQLESGADQREEEFRRMLADIKNVADEVRDAKRFNVYKQLNQNQMGHQDDSI